MSSKHPLSPEEKQKKQEEKQREQDENFMKGRPNRMEVANYVNALLTEKYMPEINNLIGQVQQSTQIGFMTLQAILIKKEICTGDEIKHFTEAFLKQQKKELEQKVKEQTEQAKEQIVNEVTKTE